MTLHWEGEEQDAAAARRAAVAREELLEHAVGEPITVANEFAEVRVRRVHTRNGARLLVESPKSGQWVALCPLELEALTWQNTATFSAMVGNPFGPRPDDGETARGRRGQRPVTTPGGWLAGRRALVVGAGSGIGRAVVDAFRAEDAQVAVLERDSRRPARWRPTARTSR